MEGIESLPVMVLAHNEERHIRNCLDSLLASDPELSLDVYVMANGCTDSTEEIVARYSEENSNIHLISIEIPDKCNAWNVFIHDTVPQFVPGRSAYIFMDGDATVVPGSLRALCNGLNQNLKAHASSAPPASGRSVRKDRRILLHERHLVANLYALRGSFVNRLRDLDVRIPLGLEGDDGLIGALVKWDLSPEEGQFDHDLIEPCPDAGFKFESMSLLRPGDWISYWRRAVRYGRRRYEFEILGNHLRERGLKALPTHISELYSDASDLKLRWNHVYTISNWFALRELRKHSERHSRSGAPADYS